MKRFNIPQVEGRFRGARGEFVSFTAVDWRKRGGDLRIYLDPPPLDKAGQPTDVIPNLVDIDAEVTGEGTRLIVRSSIKGPFVEEALPNLLPPIVEAYGGTDYMQTLDIAVATQHQWFENEDGECRSYGEVIRERILSRTREPRSRSWLMGLSQLSQRILCVRQLKGSWPEGQDQIDRSCCQMLFQLVDAINNLTPAERAELEQDDNFRKHAGEVERLANTTKAVLDGTLSELDVHYALEKTPYVIWAYVEFICAREGFDHTPYYRARYNYLRLHETTEA